MGMQTGAGSLLRVHGDAHGAECRTQARRSMTPQSEYPIFTPGFQEAALADSQSRPSFQDSDGQSIWKEIHTDTQGTGGHSSHSTSFERGHVRTPSVSATRPYAGYMEPPALHSPSTSIMTSHCFPDTPTLPECNLNSPIALHSPENVNILSPQLRSLEKIPNRTLLNIASPRLTENGGLTPMLNQLKLNTEPRPDYDPPSTMPLRAIITHQVELSSSTTSSMKLKKMLKKTSSSRPPAAPVDQSPRTSIGKDHSPGRTLGKSSRGTASAAFKSVLDGNQSVRGMTHEVNGSYQKLKSRASAAAAVTSWHGDAPVNLSKSAPVKLSNSQEYSGEMANGRAGDVVNKIIGKKAPSTQKSGYYNIFNLLSWRRKKSRDGDRGSATLKTESFLDSDLGSVKAKSESSKVLDYTIKTLRYKLEQTIQERSAAVEEVRALQAAVEASDEKCRILSQRCQELELKLSAPSSGLWDLVEPKDQLARRFPSQELTPEQFQMVFEDSIASLRKLASAICIQIREMGESATQVITALLEQHKVRSISSRMPRKVIILHFESFLNQVMFECFENVSFEPNGASAVIDPETLKQTCYESYQNLKNQDWPTIEKSLGKPGALVVNANFHRFFVVRMELIFSQLGKLAENEIPLNLMAVFFNSVKAVWLVHHMAFAFDQPVSIFRVSPAQRFDSRFMQHVTASHQDPDSKISIMLNPGFIVNRQIIKCQVYCSKYD